MVQDDDIQKEVDFGNCADIYHKIDIGNSNLKFACDIWNILAVVDDSILWV